MGQDNSPYSRYGLGDVVPNQNIVMRGMGGISAGYSSFLNVNSRNPASLGVVSNTRNFSNLIFDVGGEIDIRTLKPADGNSKYRATNTHISSLQIAFPVSSRKMEKNGINWGLSFGLRPVTRIAYKVEKNERLSGIDSLNTLYEGSGGANQVNVSTGIKFKNLSLGISSGYTFGNRTYSTEKVFVNDTVTYFKSKTDAESHFGGVFVNAGIQYLVPLEKTAFLKIGAFANFQQSMRAKQDQMNQTFVFDGIGGTTPLDTIDFTKDVPGKVILPATYAVGITYQDKQSNWLLGADFEFSNWDKFRYFGNTDQTKNNWIFHAGAEYYPATDKTLTSKYWSFVKYRIGVYYGPDYVKLDQTRNNYAATLGASFPLTVARGIAYGDFVMLNTCLEIGGRGNKNSASYRESNVRIGIGVSMNARWFQKRSYQ